MEIGRRQFLKSAGAWIAAIGAATICIGHLGAGPVAGGTEQSAMALWPDRDEQTLLTACMQCPGGCGMQARTVDGKLVEVSGYPGHPVSRGSLCSRGHAALQLHYHPDRLHMPIERAGKRGEGGWREISWDKALSRLREQISALRTAGNPESLIIASDNQPGLMGRLLERFAGAYGTPNLLFQEDLSYVPVLLMQGIRTPPSFDLEKAGFVLSFGFPFLDESCSPVSTHRAYGMMRRGREHPGKLVQLEPRLSLTASHADEWVPVAPGAYGAVALGVAYVLIKEGMTDDTFLSEHAFGFDDFKDPRGNMRRGFKRMVLEDCHPEEMAALADIPSETIVRLAKDFGSLRPQVAIFDKTLLTTPGGVESSMAVLALNALVGSLDRPGGVLFSPPVPYLDMPSLSPDPVAKKGLAMPRLDGSGRTFPFAASSLEGLEAVLSGKPPYPAKALLLHRCNPVYRLPQGKCWADAMSAIPFVAAISSFRDETVESIADLVIPDLSGFERTRDIVAPVAFGHPCVALAQPVMKPAEGSLSAEDVVINLARGLGGEAARAFPWKDFQELTQQALSGIFEARRGLVIGEPLEEILIRRLEEGGFWYPRYNNQKEFVAALQAGGGWWDPAYPYEQWGRILRSPAGRFAFYSEALEMSLCPGSSGDAGLPRPPGNTIPAKTDYPLTLLPTRLISIAADTDADAPWLEEIFGHHLDGFWDTFAEVNPETGKRLRISDGAFALIESPSGKLRVRVRYYAGIRPDVVAFPLGLGHTAGGRYARGHGQNSLDLVKGAPDRLTGASLVSGTNVRLSPV